MKKFKEQQLLEKNIELIKERLSRRTAHRLIAEVDFTYKILGEGSVYYGKCLNISSFGMAFNADTILHEKERLLFNFKLNQENVVIHGEVVRILGKEVSTEFIMSDEERERFLKLFNIEIMREDSTIRILLSDIKKRIE